MNSPLLYHPVLVIGSKQLGKELIPHEALQFDEGKVVEARVEVGEVFEINMLFFLVIWLFLHDFEASEHVGVVEHTSEEVGELSAAHLELPLRALVLGELLLHVVHDAVDVEEVVLPSLALYEASKDVKIFNEKLLHVSQNSFVDHINSHLKVWGQVLLLEHSLDSEELVDTFPGFFEGGFREL
jgi:hypothetical protein